ncbi:MAG: pilus assembly FimT family protein [Planctomycetota bacterium]|jgi:type II secretory pathway pseudopilin PulG
MSTTSRTHKTRWRPLSRRRGWAFTLFEMLVVMGIIIALVTAIAPAFSGLLASNRRANAVNTLTATLSRARSIAIEKSAETGVVFLLDIETKTTTLLIVELHSAAVGDLLEFQGGSSCVDSSQAFTLVPAENTSPVELPENVLIYGLSYHHFVAGLNTLSGCNDPANWYYEDRDGNQYFPPYYGEVFEHPDRAGWFVNPWLLPHNDPRLYISTTDHLDTAFFRTPDKVDLDEFWKLVDPAQAGSVDGLSISDTDVHKAVLNAHSFVVMFSSEGLLKPIADTGTFSASVDYYLEFPELPIDQEPASQLESEEPYDKVDQLDLQTNFNPKFINSTYLNITTPSPNPEVMLRPANMLAIVELNEFIQATAIDRPWELHSSGAMAPWPEFRGTQDAALSPLNATDTQLDELMTQVSDWIDLNASIIAFDPNSGTPQKRSADQ